MNALTGTVTAFGGDGYGFIAPDRGGGEIWLRAGGVTYASDPAEGDRVEFELLYGAMGHEAINVRELSPPVATAANPTGEPRCSNCGYGITSRASQPRCPMCGTRAWVAQAASR